MCQAAANALGKSVEDVVAFDKIAEGGSYRVFQTNLRDGTQVIARLPYPSMTRKGRAIASEVATIAYLRRCGIPIPKVYSWKSTPKNPVGSEYIIMEKAQGKPLRETWYSMTVKNRLDIVEKIVLLEKKLFDVSLPAYGSIYFLGSLPAGTPTVAILGNGEKGSDFCVGPSAEHLWGHAKRDGLGVNCGPCECCIQKADVDSNGQQGETLNSFCSPWGKESLPGSRSLVDCGFPQLRATNNCTAT